MEDLIKTYKSSGDFTHEQKREHFILPSDQILNMILESDDYNFKKTCLYAIMDFNIIDFNNSDMISKGCLTHITRPIESMSPNGRASGRFDKKKWSKRVRGYFKSQTNTFYNDDKL